MSNAAPRSAKYLRYLSGMARKAAALDRFFIHRAVANTNDVVVALAGTDAKLIVDIKDSMMSRSLLLTGVYEPHVTRVFRDLVKPDSTILDIGANIGYFSVLGASLAPQGKVYAFEPDPGNHQRLIANVFLNGFQGRVDAANMAVGEKEGEIVLTNLGAKNAGGRLTVDSEAQVEALFGAGFARVKVPSVVLDDKLPDVEADVIKIDIEGYEPKAFAGMRRILERCKPAILCEFSPSNLASIGGMQPEAFLGFFLKLGYPLCVIEFETGKLIPFGEDAAGVVSYCRNLGYDHVDLLFKQKA